jgi:hypothetical protein
LDLLECTLEALYEECWLDTGDPDADGPRAKPARGVCAGEAEFSLDPASMGGDGADVTGGGLDACGDGMDECAIEDERSFSSSLAASYLLASPPPSAEAASANIDAFATGALLLLRDIFGGGSSSLGLSGLSGGDLEGFLAALAWARPAPG